MSRCAWRPADGLPDNGLSHLPAGRHSREGHELFAAIRAFSVDHEFEDDVCLVGLDFIGQPAGKP